MRPRPSRHCVPVGTCAVPSPTSFRADPPLLRFVNDLFTAIGAAGKQPDEPETFRYAEQDRFPLESAAPAYGDGALGPRCCA